MTTAELQCFRFLGALCGLSAVSYLHALEEITEFSKEEQQ